MFYINGVMLHAASICMEAALICLGWTILGYGVLRHVPLFREIAGLGTVQKKPLHTPGLSLIREVEMTHTKLNITNETPGFKK